MAGERPHCPRGRPSAPRAGPPASRLPPNPAPERGSARSRPMPLFLGRIRSVRPSSLRYGSVACHNRNGTATGSRGVWQGPEGMTEDGGRLRHAPGGPSCRAFPPHADHAPAMDMPSARRSHISNILTESSGRSSLTTMGSSRPCPPSPEIPPPGSVRRSLVRQAPKRPLADALIAGKTYAAWAYVFCVPDFPKCLMEILFWLLKFYRLGTKTSKKSTDEGIPHY